MLDGHGGFRIPSLAGFSSTASASPSARAPPGPCFHSSTPDKPCLPELRVVWVLSWDLDSQETDGAHSAADKLTLGNTEGKGVSKMEPGGPQRKSASAILRPGNPGPCLSLGRRRQCPGCPFQPGCSLRRFLWPPGLQVQQVLLQGSVGFSLPHSPSRAPRLWLPWPRVTPPCICAVSDFECGRGEVESSNLPVTAWTSCRCLRWD